MTKSRMALLAIDDNLRALDDAMEESYGDSPYRDGFQAGLEQARRQIQLALKLMEGERNA